MLISYILISPGVFDCSGEASEDTLLSYLAQLPPSPGTEEGEGEESGMEEEPRVAIMKDAASSTLKGFIVVDVSILTSFFIFFLNLLSYLQILFSQKYIIEDKK